MRMSAPILFLSGFLLSLTAFASAPNPVLLKVDPDYEIELFQGDLYVAIGARDLRAWNLE